MNSTRVLAAMSVVCFACVCFAQRSTPVQVLHPTGAAGDQFGHSIAMDGDTAIVGAVTDDVGGNTDQGSAHVYRRTASGWMLESTLLASDGAAADNFGYSVAIFGDTAIVGAGFANVGANTNQGSAYIFTRSGTTWTQQAKLTASDGAAGAYFGWSVAISGETVIVGAFYESVGANSRQGSAYVFTRSGTVWSQQARLTASDGAALDNFGGSVAISGETAIVGADLDDVGASTDQGSAYVYTRSGTTWSQQAKLTASDGAAGDRFGRSVAISADAAIVGSAYDDVGAATDQGSAYVYARSGTTWSQQAKLTAPDGTTVDLFGIAVAISGKTAIVGALNDTIGAIAAQGSAHVFTLSGTTWTQQAKLTAPDGATSEYFGGSVAACGDTVMAGVVYDDVGANGEQGSAWIFSRIGSTWIGQDLKLIASDGAANDRLGTSVAFFGDTAIVGAAYDDVGANLDQGSAYIFTRSGTTWSQQAKLTASDGATSDYFGWSVGISGETAIVGSVVDDVGANPNQGSVYVFTRSGTTWSQQAKLTASDGATSDYFGWSVAISGETAIVGANYDAVGANSSQGSAYVFTRSGTAWSQQAKLLASDGAAFDNFGVSVAISGETAIVGADVDDVGTSTDQGSTYVFTRAGTVWSQQAKLTASDGAAGDQFGHSVAIFGDTVLVGAFYDAVGANLNQGSAYVFTRSGTVWSQQTKLTASDGAQDDTFGNSVAIFGDTAVVGAANDDIGANSNQGSAYVFTRANTVWTHQAKLTASDGAAADTLGWSVAIYGDTAIVGSFYDDVGANSDQGSVLKFDVAANDFSVAMNDVTNASYPTLAAAMLPATSGQQITATEAAWRTIGSINTLGRSLGLNSYGDIRTPSTSTIDLGGSSAITAAPNSVVEIFGQLRVAGYGNIDASSFLVGSRGILTARTASSLYINAPSAVLQGQTRLESGASMTVNGVLLNQDTLNITQGDLTASLVENQVIISVLGTSGVFGDFLNSTTAVTTIRSGTLYVFGSLTNNGTIIGTICSGCTSTPPNMDVGGSLNLGSAANLNMPFLGSTVRVGGNFDCAINSNTRYDMSLATLQLEGTGAEQTLEVMSLDIGADVNGLDRSLPGHYPINTLHIGTSPSTVRLVDVHDNDSAGQAVCEAIYVDTLRIDAGSRLINTSCKIYYNTLVNNGVIDVPANVISLQPTFCPADFNQDGGVDSDDVIGFFAAWDVSDAAADFNGDGGVDSDDVIGFFGNWDAGC